MDGSLIEQSIRITIQVGLMGLAILTIMFVMVLIGVKMKSVGHWYVEINFKGQLRDVLVKPIGGAFEWEATKYFLPKVARMDKLYPPGLPMVLQVNVPHEKYVAGNPHPIDIPELVTDQGIGQYLAQLSESRTTSLKNATEAWNSSQNKGLKTFEILMFAGMLIAVVAAGAAAYFSYDMSEQVAAISKALRGL